MKIVSINKEITLKNHEVVNTNEKDFYNIDFSDADYVLVSGGDGLLRRIIEYIIFSGQTKPAIMIEPKGSFNVIAKKHFVPKIDKVLAKLEAGEELNKKMQDVYKLNKHVFLFSAGNLHDALHIHLSEIFRVGFLKKGVLKYLISTAFVLPIAIVTLPFLFFSKKRFIVLTVLRSFNFMNFYTKIEELHVDLGSEYNLLEIDGDLIFLQDRYIDIKLIDQVAIVVK